MMRDRLRYFIFNKKKDFERGYGERVQWRERSLCRSADEGEERSFFFSRILDSRERGMEWHRLSFKTEENGRVPVRISVYASDHWTGEMELFKDPGLDIEDKEKRLLPFLKRRAEGQSEILLHGIVGRFLWFSVEFLKSGPEAGPISELRIEFPKQTLMEYLPEIYRKSDRGQFLERYLAVFQTLYAELNQAIREAPYLLDADTVSGEALPWLAGWLGIADSFMWPEDRLRCLLKHGTALYRKRGTREGILSFLRLYTGTEAWMVETHQLERLMIEAGMREAGMHEAGMRETGVREDGIQKSEMRESLTRLYGRDPGRITVILRKEAVPTQKEYRAILAVLREVTPVQASLRLVVLEPYLFLGFHTYLGINSTLGEYRAPVLDGQVMMPFAALKKERTQEESE